jgi:hypothetical protein
VRWVLSMICVLAAGCSMPKPALPTASSLGYERIGGGILRIAVPKSALADCASADECTLVKAAEATQRVGGTHFMVLPGHSSSAQGGYAYIRVFTFGADERAPSTAMPVEEALHFLRKPQGQAAAS